jgi:hypothetical protein
MFEEDEDKVSKQVDPHNESQAATVEALIALESRIDEKLQTAMDRLDSTDERLTSFTEEYTATRELDMLAFADHSEKQDYTSNQAKAMFVLVTGKQYYLIVVKRKFASCQYLTGLRTMDYPKTLPEQNAKVKELLKDLIPKILGRDEPFSVILRKSGQRRYAKDTSEVIVPPLEVGYVANPNRFSVKSQLC